MQNRNCKFTLFMTVNWQAYLGSWKYSKCMNQTCFYLSQGPLTRKVCFDDSYVFPVAPHSDHSWLLKTLAPAGNIARVPVRLTRPHRPHRQTSAADCRRTDALETTTFYMHAIVILCPVEYLDLVCRRLKLNVKEDSVFWYYIMKNFQ